MDKPWRDRASRLVDELRRGPPSSLIAAVRAEGARLARAEREGSRERVDTNGIIEALIKLGVFGDTDDTEDATQEFRAVVAWDLFCALRQ
jgi:hypothetical protein